MVKQRLNMRLPAARIRALSRLRETAIENGGVGGDDEHDLFQQIVDGSKERYSPISCSNWPGRDSHLRRELNSNPGTLQAKARRRRAVIG